MPDPIRVARTLARIHALGPGPVPWPRAHAAGVTAGQWRAAVASGGLRLLRRGIGIPEETWSSGSDDDRHRWLVEAAVLAYPGAWASHESAARLLGLPAIDPGAGNAGQWPTVHVTRPGAARRDDWLVVHGCDAPSGRIVLLDGLPATDVVRTTIELASTRSLRRAVAYIDAGMRLALSAGPGDSGLRERVLDSEARRRVRIAWREALGPYTGYRWVTRVRTAVDWADPAAESVLESLSRAELIQAGLPRPRCGVPVLGDDGRTYYADVLWDEERVIGEADGLTKYGGVADLVDEKRRQEALEAAGWTIVRWGWREGVTHPDVMIGRVSRALQARRRAAS